MSIFLNFLTPKLPAPIEEDLSKGILEVIDMDGPGVETGLGGVDSLHLDAPTARREPWARPCVPADRRARTVVGNAKNGGAATPPPWPPNQGRRSSLREGGREGGREEAQRG